jgi:hypothetical protein
VLVGGFSFSGDLSARAHAQPHLLNIKENESELAKVDALLAAVGEELEANTLPPIGCPAKRATRTHKKKKKKNEKDIKIGKDKNKNKEKMNRNEDPARILLKPPSPRSNNWSETHTHKSLSPFLFYFFIFFQIAFWLALYTHIDDGRLPNVWERDRRLFF